MSEEDNPPEDLYRFGLLIGADDLSQLHAGTHPRPWTVLGAHSAVLQGLLGVRFAVWAPNAQRVSVVGGFNRWDGRRHPMYLRREAGIWEIFIPAIADGTLYKYEVLDAHGALRLKADPYAFGAEMRPATASIVERAPAERDLPAGRALANSARAPVSIYEVHLPSWRRGAAGEILGWDVLAEQLPAYAADLGFTHIELMPVAEYPFDGSWGYQVLGMYAPTRRHGDIGGLGRLIAACHARGIGVLLDWVPAHFPSDEHGLARFDGTALYEHADPREGVHHDWNTLIYNFGRREVCNFLVGNALYWLRCHGADGLRVDAVASMLYRDYSRKPGEWVPNAYGGRENLEAMALLRQVNQAIAARAPGCITAAEESTAWPGVTRAVDHGGLGFQYKWNMGWMHDTLAYFSHDSIHRRWHQGQLTFSLLYAFDEHFILPLSHDEVVHGKGSLLGKMPGDRWQKFANLRALLAYQWTHPGKKLLFMGGEFAQPGEWNHDHALDWDRLNDPAHRGIQALVRDLNRHYSSRPALHALDCERGGFEWLSADDAEHSVLGFMRRGPQGEQVLVACNFTPVPRRGFRLGLPAAGAWREVLNTDAGAYGGSNLGNGGFVLHSQPHPAHGREHSLELVLPPLAVLLFEPA